MKVLVTGGVGFIGSHVVSLLAGLGHSVTVVDWVPWKTFANIQQKNVYFIRAEVTDRAIMAQLVMNADWIIHLAAVVGKKVNVDIQHSISTNLYGTNVVFELATRLNKKVLFASSANIYRRFLPVKAESFYSHSKLIGETIGHLFRQEGLKLVICRLFPVAGAGQTEESGATIPTYVGKALRNEDIEIAWVWDTKSFTSVYDVADVFAGLLTAPEAIGETVDVCMPTYHTLKSLAEMIINKTGSSSKVVFPVNGQRIETGWGDPNLGTVKRLLGRVPEITVEEIIDEVIEYETSRLCDS